MKGFTRDDVEAIRSSGLFDEKWYLEQYPDVKALGMDPAEHYLWLGARLGRNPSERFDATAYVSDNSDLVEKTIDPILHYLRHGRDEGRKLRSKTLQEAIKEAEFSSREKDWQAAKEYWQQIKILAAEDIGLRGRAALNFSICKRMHDLTEYLGRISKYNVRNNTEKIVIFSAISGKYDSLKLPEFIDFGFDYVLYSDECVADSGLWQVHPIPYNNSDKTRMARFVKTNPHRLLGQYDIAVWIDSNIMITGDIRSDLSAFVKSNLPVGAIPHPERTNIYDEAEACILAGKGNPERIKKQMDFYKKVGFRHNDLIESNLIFFNLTHSGTHSFLDTWWKEISLNSKRDQLSLNYALWKNSLSWHPITSFPNSARNHPALAFGSHGRHDDGLSEVLLNAVKEARLLREKATELETNHPASRGSSDLGRESGGTSQLRVIQFTPPKTANAYYTMIPHSLEKLGCAIECTTDWKAIASDTPEKKTIVHFHQLEPLYHRETEQETRIAAEKLFQNILAASTKGYYIVLTWHNPFPHNRRFLEVDNWLYNKLSSIVNKAIVHLKSAVSFVENYMPKENIAVVTHPSFYNVYGPIKDKDICKEKLKINRDSFVFLSLGEIKGYKGHQFLINSWNKFFHQISGSDVTLLIAGKVGSDINRESLKGNGIRTEFKYIPDDEIHKYLSAADVAVYNHKDIWTSGAAILAKSYGLPVIMPSTKYTAEYIREGDNGFLYEDCKEDSLVSVLKDALQSELLDHIRYINLFESENNSPIDYAKKLCKIYQEL